MPLLERLLQETPVLRVPDNCCNDGWQWQPREDYGWC